AATHIVYGHGGELLPDTFASWAANWVEQKAQLGTGHAVAQALPTIPDDAPVLVLFGDVPLISSETLQALLQQASSDTLALLTVVRADPSGYGRIIRQGEQISAIVEEKDADDKTRTITEVNTGLMAAPAHFLKQAVARLGNRNAQGEYYLTDVVAMAAPAGLQVTAVTATSEVEVEGINSKSQLAICERQLQLTRAHRLMAQGTTLIDPARLDIRGDVTVGRDVTIDINVVLEGKVILGDGVVVGAHSVISNSIVGDQTEIKPFSSLDGAVIGAHCSIGPYARLRPESHLGEASRVGNFVELKKTTLGAGSKVNHLAYVGDATIGERTNIGAGVITCNYDGANKHQTRIGDDAFVGSDCQLVAPVTIGDGATIGAGTTLTRNAPAHQLTLSRPEQVTVAGWRRPTKGRD
ncbi:MAG: bifunctional UDP-N-acetylglucosamine diphosphorylase/glucosamine-1-phosphate N-acetyltransferase GlmU, partial [Gammaproteobacteria bacterium]|nr:bifunctional UDP-N-acetylglucosamine diphosphorylase/glucosamine-1-phosphate N-acetyltransferase GlmU [Gammaproteobacteria bacterium]